MNNAINNIGFALDSAAQNAVTFVEAEKIYSGLYRCDPLSVEEIGYEESLDALNSCLKDMAFTVWCKDNNFCESNDLYDEWCNTGMVGFAEVFEIPCGMMFCETCNYKGEEEGPCIAPYDAVKHLPVFVSKYNYI